MAVKRVSLPKLKSFKEKTIVFSTILVFLLAAITVGGINLANHLKGQDELLTSGLNRSERGLCQLDREVLRLAAMVLASHTGFDLEAANLQRNLVESRLGVIRKHHISSDLGPELAAELDEFVQAWDALQPGLSGWLQSPQNAELQAALYSQLVDFELIVNDLANRHGRQRREQYLRLVTLRSKAIRLITIISILFLIFTGFAIVSTLRFIRERQGMLTAIREQEAQYRRIIETSAEGIWLLDASGNTTFANHKVAEILGLAEADLSNRCLWDFLPSQADVEKAKAYLSDLSRGIRIPYDLRLMRSDGQGLWILINGTAIFDDTGAHLGTLCMLTDVTARRQAEEALKTAKQKAELASQAKSEFLANMSHELRTPLNSIMGYAQILGRSQGLPEQTRSGVDIIYRSSCHLLTLINDVLDLSKIEARKLPLNPVALHLPTLLQGVVEMCQLKTEQKGIKFIYQPSPYLPTGAIVDEKRLRQVLLNLLGNAIKFTDTGSVTLRLEVQAHASNAAAILFRVIDTGIGIAPENIDKLFSAFEQVGDRQRHSEGTGLGLAISQRIVQLMGGHIQVRSQLHQGSEFFFTIKLPLVQMGHFPQTPSCNRVIVGYLNKGTATAKQPQKTDTILVVDDQRTNRTVIVNLLAPLGFSLLEAQDGEAGFEQFLEAQPELVITDIAMPNLDGFQLLQKIRSHAGLKPTKVIVSSAFVAQSDREMAFSHGADYFLPKPVDAEALYQALSHCLDIEWQYAAPQEGSPQRSITSLDRIALPPDETLEVLLALARRDNIRALREKLGQLAALDERYTPFVNPIFELAKQFQSEQIESLLEDYLARA